MSEINREWALQEEFDCSDGDEPEHDDDSEGEEHDLDVDRFNNEYRLPPGSMCVHHDDEPAVSIRDGEPVCEQCNDDYCETFLRDD